MTTTTNVRCPVCRAPEMKVFMRIDRAAVLANVLWRDRDEAVRAPRAGISLGFCGGCGMLYNVDFDPDQVRYSQRYENALDYSPRFRRYADDLARRLVRAYDLHGKDIVEIGCGQGNFLALLAMLGDNRAVGYDPSHDRARASDETKARTDISVESFSRTHAGRPADFVCCRHVLEHIAEPLAFLADVRTMLEGRPKAVVYMEVPNALHMLRELSIWDIIYEHCSYYTPASLSRLFESAGFRTLAVSEAYGGQFLGIEATPREAFSPDGEDADAARWPNPPEFGALVRRFQQAYADKVAIWRKTLDDLVERMSRTVVWGAGSKGISFLNALDVTPRQIEYAVDLNPYKQGRFLTGAGQEVVAPVYLAEYRPDTVVIMNSIYREEIDRTLKEMALAPEVYVA